MNWNSIRTFILGSGILVVVMPVIVNWVTALLGCIGDNPATEAIELTVCTGGSLLTIPGWLQAGVATLVLAALGVIKAVSGSGTVKQNLFAPAVPVVPAAEAKPGVVTAAQVAVPGPLK